MTDTNAQPSYNEALKELEAILAGLRADNCDVDTLAAKTARAAELLSYCRKKLTRTEEELADVLASLDQAIES